jgi:hypothetical protein
VSYYFWKRDPRDVVLKYSRPTLIRTCSNLGVVQGTLARIIHEMRFVNNPN